MKKLGFSIFEVEEGEEIRLKISLINVPDMPLVLLDGIGLEASDKDESAATYEFQVQKPVGESHRFMVRFPHTNLEDAEYKVELFGAGEPIDYQLVKPTGGQPRTNLIYTFSTHGAGGGSRD